MKKIVLLIGLLTTFSVVEAQLLKKIKDKVDKKVDDASSGKKEEKKNTEENQTTETNTNNTNQPATMKAYSKYDFVPGEKIIGFEDFSAANIGDFPAGWNTTASGEVVTVEGKPGRWLWFTARGEFTPEFPQPFPEDFTFEFDLLHGIPINGAAFTVCIAELENLDQPHTWAMAPNRFAIELNNASTGSQTGGTRFNTRKDASIGVQNGADASILSDKNNPVHVSIWRQKERVRVYVNEQKIWDVPKAVTKDAKFNSVIFSVIYAEEVVKHFIGNLRFAVGAPDTRKKILEQNKWVTHGILFDVNKADIKPESYGTLKEMASVLKEYPDIKVKIVGHTDSDGADAANLDLSKKRAASVKMALANEFSIDESRMETDGKGEAEPMDKATTPAAKANNRRVEFIKL